MSLALTANQPDVDKDIKLAARVRLAEKPQQYPCLRLTLSESLEKIEVNNDADAGVFGVP